MKYCTNCSKEITDSTQICPECGTAQGAVQPKEGNKLGFGVLGFFIPVAGLILYLMWKNEKPQTAKAAGKGALISVILSVVLSVVMTVASMFFISSEMDDMEEYMGEDYYAEEIYDFDI